ncbi:MAG: nucleotidyltransferase family protein [candidate division Zixibacteria bacterium]
MKISGVVLAAGKSSRMGPNKLLLRYRDHSVIEEVLTQISNSDLGEVMVITGFENDKVKGVIKKFSDSFRIVYNGKYEMGRAESIKRAVENVAGDSDALLFMVGDKPTVKTELINKAIDEFKRKSQSILYVMTPEGRGHPIIFSKKFFGKLLGLSGDLVGNELIEKYKNDVIELADDHIQVDIDTPDDYEGLTE